MSEDDRSKLARLEERWSLNDEIDRLAEIAVRDRLPVDHTMRLVMPALRSATGARVAWVRTYDESLELHDFVDGASVEEAPPIPWDELASAKGPLHRSAGGVTIFVEPLDVAGDAFGAAAVLVPGSFDGPEKADRIAGLLHTFCEEIDNTLASIAVARKKTIVIGAMSEALRDPVLDAGVIRAIAVLEEAVPFEDMVLVFRHEDDASGRTLQYKIIEGRKLVHDSNDPAVDRDVDAFLRSHASRLMAGDDEEVRERFGIRRHREEVLITGVRSARVIGRLIVTSKRGDFNTFDRDLLDRFADFLRQRIVDYNREWKNLSSTFSRAACDRLLHEEGYREKYLTARDRQCAVMFCDISGFTRVCEQVLVRPEAIGRLVDTWSARVVEIVWETGGVFDKMVGDCVIGIWGPPFFDRRGRELCLSALDASKRIREFTRSIVTHESLPELAGAEPLDVATGLHWCPLFVGIFGPDEDYTGFSAGMNNTARLQGQAKGGEIFCMDTFVAEVGEPSFFGEPREAKVKNVEHALRFRALR